MNWRRQTYVHLCFMKSIFQYSPNKNIGSWNLQGEISAHGSRCAYAYSDYDNGQWLVEDSQSFVWGLI